ncbi:transporter substrate-binding domain-containing protein [Tissierella pigra]|uniref:Transporter substrate-binding domain-containing protein n=1 Tax=Tissierella pigra TaxID=2607614 RepID=A0A6N7XSL6_9FIRM|nr:transporter substrate-binding domain-containing protein [Tissierella pigra]MSU00413.1 transporter substrate-binding domain-containing protein [Tissierella pigra]
MKKKIGLVLAGIMLFSIILTACGGNSSNRQINNEENNIESEVQGLDSIIQKKKIVLGTSADYPPFEFHTMIDGKDTIVGLDIEIAKYIADELGVELEIKDMEFDKLLGGLATGMLDIVIAGMTPEDGREANFTDIYYEADLSVLVSKNNPSGIATIDDLIGKSIGVQIGTTQENIVQTTIKDAEVKSLSTNPDIVMNLKTQKIDCAVMETIVAESFAKANDDLMVVENLTIDSGAGGVAIAIQKGNDELTKKLNEIIAKLKSEGLIDKWLIEADKLSSEGL